MSRDYFINGESMVAVKGCVTSAIANLTNLGLTADAIRVSLNFIHKGITLDAWGGQVEAETQLMLASADIVMNLIHFDRTVLDACITESMGGAPLTGSLPRAGTRLGGGAVRFAAGNHYIGLNIASPIAGKTWRFLHSYITGPAIEFPLGTEKSVCRLHWHVIPYTVDPWNAGAGALGTFLFDYNADT